MRKNLPEIVDYIIRFLLCDVNAEHSQSVGYTSIRDDFSKYKIVITPSGFFDEENYGTPGSIPSLPLNVWEETPILHGKPTATKVGETWIIHADIIASTFFLISRYEEVVRKDSRDEHGRFIGRESLLYKAGVLHRPIVDEYGKIVRSYLRKAGLPVVEPEDKISKIYLTHDVDQLAHYRNVRGMGGAISRFFKSPYQAFKAIQTYAGGIKFDPWYTFPWLFDLAFQLKQANQTTKIESIAFIKSGGGNTVFDKPIHNVDSSDFKHLFNLCKKNNVEIGLHPSYQAGLEPELIGKEKAILEQAAKQPILYSRNHFLANREPEDLHALIKAGITDDFTMAYADISGFRLGTSKAVRWIDPGTFQLTSLTLHPLTIMECTLHDERYMGLNADEAFSFSKNLIKQVKAHNGELVLLWHNTSVEKNNGQYHRDLYNLIIDYLSKE